MRHPVYSLPSHPITSAARSLIAATMITAAASGCSSSSRLTSLEESRAAVAEDSNLPVPGSALDRLVISSARIKLESPTEDSVHRAVISLALTYGGYVVSSTDNKTTIRVAASDFEAMLTEIEAWGRLLSREVEGQDVTEAFKDLTTRLDNAERARQRYLALLAKTRSLEETLRLETEIRRLTMEIELFKGRLNQLEHEIKFATITVETTPEPSQGGPGILVAGVIGIAKGIKGLIWR